MLITVGTGLGTAVFHNGVLVPNTELGHIEIDGQDAEDLATSRVKKQLGLDNDAWAARLSVYLQRLEALLWPDAPTRPWPERIRRMRAFVRSLTEPGRKAHRQPEDRLNAAFRLGSSALL